MWVVVGVMAAVVVALAVHSLLIAAILLVIAGLAIGVADVLMVRRNMRR